MSADLEPKSATLEFYRRFCEYLENQGVTALVLFGVLSLSSREEGPGTANRIVICPGDANGNGGKLGPVRGPGERRQHDADGNYIGSIRGLMSWDQTIYVSVWGVDTTFPDSLPHQHAATETLLQWAIRAISNIGLSGDIVMGGNVTYLKPTVLKEYGVEMRFSFTLQQTLFDVPMEPGFASPRVNRPEHLGPIEGEDGLDALEKLDPPIQDDEGD